MKFLSKFILMAFFSIVGLGQTITAMEKLGPDEFRTIFGMSKEDFAKMPVWKQEKAKAQKADMLGLQPIQAQPATTPVQQAVVQPYNPFNQPPVAPQQQSAQYTPGSYSLPLATAQQQSVTPPPVPSRALKPPLSTQAPAPEVKQAAVVPVQQQAQPASSQIIDNYSVMPLPENFYVELEGQRVLNNNGQIAGYISSEISNRNFVLKGRGAYMPYPMNAKPAYWDPRIGVQSLNLEDKKVTAWTLNDQGFIVILDPRSKIALWDTKTNKLKFGPLGYPWAINDDNLVITRWVTDLTIWDSKDDAIIPVPKTDNYFYKKIGANKQLNPLMPPNFPGSKILELNNNGSTISAKGPNIFLTYNGKIQPISFNGKTIRYGSSERTSQDFNVLLNDKDEVAGLTTEYAIAKYKKNGEVTFSANLQSLPELKGYNNFEILGFNNSGQILLQAYTDIYSIKGKSRLFLLNPIK